MPKPPVTITTMELPPGVLGQPYEVQLEVAQANGPCHWSVYEGRLPLGLRLTDGGLIEGVIEAGGEFEFIARVHDVTNARALRGLGLSVRVAAPVADDPESVASPFVIPPALVAWAPKSKAKAGTEPDPSPFSPVAIETDAADPSPTAGEEHPVEDLAQAET